MNHQSTVESTSEITTAPEVAPNTWAYRVYYEDSDAGGVVYHSRYLNFFERARTEWLRKCGVHHDELRREQGIIFVVTSMNITWKKAAVLDDVVLVSAVPYPVSGVRMGFKQWMVRASDDALIAEADVGAAILSIDGYRPVRIPSWIRQEFEKEPNKEPEEG